MSDYKWQAQVRAEELADQIYQKDFYELAEPIRDSLYRRALRSNFEDMVDRADYLRKAEREK